MIWRLAGLAIALSACGTTVVVATQPSSLVALEDLAAGDVDCPGGGVRIVTGNDDGAGGGIAGDHVMQPGERDDQRVVCDDVPVETDAPVSPYLPLTPAEGPAGTARIDVAGGDGDLVEGGKGGTIALDTLHGSARGHLAIHATGAVSPAPALPPAPRIDLGGTPLELDHDLVLPELALDAEREIGDVFVRAGTTSIMIEDGQGGRIVSGVHVPAGVRLTLPADPTGTRTISLRSGVLLEGTLTVSGGGSRNLALYCASFYGTEDATIDTIGAPGDVDVAGEDGGDVAIVVTSTELGASISLGQARMDGRVDTSGGDGRDGGDAGGFTLSTSSHLIVGGTILALGGDALAPAGIPGDAPAVLLSGPEGFTRVHGSVDVTGGSGGTRGGRGGQVIVRGATIDSRATFVADGGAGADPCDTRCSGGPGGGVRLTTAAGAIRHDGSVHAAGGAGHGTASRGGDGGRGGTFSLGTDDGATGPFTPEEASIEVGGDVVLTGGTGTGGGGIGGRLDVTLEQGVDEDASARLLGYAALDLHGGDAAHGTAGGTGGSLIVEVDGDDAAGGIALYVPVDVQGGAGSLGGDGGSVVLTSDVHAGDAHPDRAVVVSADLDLDGGDGRAVGGTSGYLDVDAELDVTVSGSIRSVSGVSAHGAGSAAGHASTGHSGVELISHRGRVELHASVVQHGGDADGDGGDAGWLRVLGLVAVFDGAIEASGGESVAAHGGRGGVIEILSLSPPSIVSGTIEVPPGDGAITPGGYGQIWVDGVAEPTGPP